MPSSYAAGPGGSRALLADHGFWDTGTPAAHARVLGDLAASTDSEDRRASATHPRTPAQVLSLLVTDPDLRVACAAALHPSLADRDAVRVGTELEAAARATRTSRSVRAPVMWALALNTHLAEGVRHETLVRLYRAAPQLRPRTRDLIRTLDGLDLPSGGNPDAGEGAKYGWAWWVLDRLLANSEADVRRIAVAPLFRFRPNDQAHPYSYSSHQARALADTSPRVVGEIAAATSDPGLLHRLAAHEALLVRRRVAGNPNVAMETVTLLLADRDAKVRARATDRLADRLND